MGSEQVEENEMPGIDLKNFDEYFDKLEMYAKAHGIKIKYSAEDGFGSYEFKRRTLRIDPDLSNSCEIAVILHELGHCLDDMAAFYHEEEKVTVAYSRIYNDKHSKKELKLVLACENKAWDYGRVIAKKLKIPLGKWYDEIREICIEGYKEV